VVLTTPEVWLGFGRERVCEREAANERMARSRYEWREMLRGKREEWRSRSEWGEMLRGNEKNGTKS